MGTSRVKYGTQGQQERELHVWGGIVSARVSDIADVLGAQPQEVAQALQDVTCLVDTAQQKRQERDRPTDPSLRSVSMTTDQLEVLRSELETEG